MLGARLVRATAAGCPDLGGPAPGRATDADPTREAERLTPNASPAHHTVLR